MSLLISNDDGVHAEGIRVLANTLSTKYQLKVVAPDRDHSGASGSLTLGRPLQVTELENGFFCVDGTPTDSVHLGLSAVFDGQFDGRPDEKLKQSEEGKFTRVISGINSHENLGDDVLYSGTVAAAIEGRFLPESAMAVSLVNRGRYLYDTAAQVVMKLLSKEKKLNLPARTILNINVPDIPFEQLKGIKVTRLGHRSKGQAPQEVSDPRGRQRYWIALAGEGDDAGPGTDFHAVMNDYVSVTPMQVDMTRHEELDTIKNWLEE